MSGFTLGGAAVIAGPAGSNQPLVQNIVTPAGWNVQVGDLIVFQSHAGGLQGTPSIPGFTLAPEYVATYARMLYRWATAADVGGGKTYTITYTGPASNNAEIGPRSTHATYWSGGDTAVTPKAVAITVPPNSTTTNTATMPAGTNGKRGRLITGLEWGTGNSAPTWLAPHVLTTRQSTSAGMAGQVARSFDGADGQAGADPINVTGPSSNGTSPQVQLWAFEPLVALNTAPNPPAVSFASSTVDRTSTVRVSVPFSDPDVGDSQTKAEVRWRIGAGAWTTITNATANPWVDVPASSLAAADYEFQGQSYDAAAVASGWGASAFVTFADPPAAPVITSPANLANITAGTVTATFTAAAQTQFQWQVLGDLAGAADPNNVVNAGATVVDSAARSFTVTGLTNGTTVHVRVRVLNAGLWSAWADSKNPVVFTPPATPTLAMTTVGAATRVTITNPAPTGGQPAVTTLDLWRRVTGSLVAVRLAVGLAAGATFDDYKAASRQSYQYQARAYGANGTTSDSAWTS